jgi:hypothetical protein
MIFEEMVRQGHVVPVEHMENLRLPGEYVSVPTILTYTTPDIPIRSGVHVDAKLGQHPERDIYSPGHHR